MTKATLPVIMGRIREEINVDGRQCWTLFDSGARNSYIRKDAAQGLPRVRREPREAAFGGKVHQITEVCLVPAEVEGHSLEFQAAVVDEIGQDEAGRQIDVLFGSLAMQLWGIKLDIPNERLDFTHFSTEFVEY